MAPDSKLLPPDGDTQTLSENDLGLIVKTLGRGSCILLLGSGVRINTTSGARNLVHDLAEKLAGTEFDRPANLPTIARRYEQQHGGRGYLDLAVEEFYQGAAAQIDDDCVLAKLARLPFRMIVTSRHDHTFDRHLQEAGKQPVPVCFDLSREAPHIPEPTEQAPVVFYLCGDLEDTTSLIITEPDVLKLVDSVARGDPGIPHRIKSEFARRGAMALLVGFGVPKWYNRVILKALGMKASGEAFQSFAFGEFDEFRDHWQERGRRRSADLETQLFFDEEFKIRSVLDQHLEDLVDRLLKRWEEEGAPAPSAAAGPRAEVSSATKGKVFISYCSDDKEHARALFAAMQHRPELDPFIDEDGLRGGDHWLARLEEKVRESDYFVLVVSPTLHDREESVVHEEVLFAQARARRLPPKKRKKFIFPVLVDGERRIYEGEGFDGIHHVDDPGQLIEAICQEQRRRSTT